MVFCRKESRNRSLCNHQGRETVNAEEILEEIGRKFFSLRRRHPRVGGEVARKTVTGKPLPAIRKCRFVWRLAQRFAAIVVRQRRQGLMGDLRKICFRKTSCGSQSVQLMRRALSGADGGAFIIHSVHICLICKICSFFQIKLV